MNDQTSFICYASHQLPDENLLNNNIRFRQQRNYTIAWLTARGAPMPKKKTIIIQPNEIALVQFRLNSLGLLPIPMMQDSTDAPYGLSYDFALRDSGTIYTPIASFYGYIVFTTPEHDMLRSKVMLNLCNYPSALLHLDRAIITLSERVIIDAKIDKAYRRFSKLQNLYLDQYTRPEGKLAFELAMRHGQACYQLLLAAPSEDPKNETA